MHPVVTMKHWSHHLRDGMTSAWHHIDQHLHSRHFWMGMGIALLAVFFVSIVFLLITQAPFESTAPYPHSFPYGPYR